MPSVNLSEETYETLERMASQRGCTADEVAQEAVRALAREADSEWSVRLEAIERKPGNDLTEDEADLVSERAVSEVRAERWARNLSPDERLAQWQAALAEVRSGIPEDISEAEIEADIAASLKEVRAERRARGH